MKKTHVFLSSAFRDVYQGADNYVKTLVDQELTAVIALELAADTLQTREYCVVNSLIDHDNVVLRGPKWRMDRVQEKEHAPQALHAIYRPSTIVDCDEDIEFERNLPPWIVVRAIPV